MERFIFLDHPTYGRVIRDTEPNVCPHCTHRVVPEELVWSIAGSNYQHLECVYKCTNRECGHLFVATYRLVEQKHPTADAERMANAFGIKKARYELDSTWPVQVPKSAFAAELAKVSPTFIEIYNQAEEAEARGLLEVCGLGYRKSVEFLIKDYCSSEHPTEAEAIKAMPLAQCIAKYVRDPRIETVASRAAWLGNDEAHYVRKWIGKDISDLKVLVRLTCNWIESALLTRHYQNEMPR
jgi:hypothetical protein